MTPSFSTPLECQTRALQEAQTHCLETGQQTPQFIFGGNNWTTALLSNFDYQLVFRSAVEIEFGEGFQTWQDSLCYLTSATEKTWGVVCYYLFNVDGLQFRTDGDPPVLVPWFQGTYHGFCMYPQPMYDWFSNVGGIGIIPPKFSNGAGITLYAAGTKGLITKHTIVSTDGGGKPILLAPASPLNVEAVHLLVDGLVGYSCSEAQAVIFWIGLAADDPLPSINFNPEDENLLTFAYPH